MSSPRKRRRGRPPKSPGSTKGIRLDMRLAETEKEAFRAAAELSGLDLSAWIRERLRQVARRELREAGRPVAFLEVASSTVKARQETKEGQPASSSRPTSFATGSKALRSTNAGSAKVPYVEGRLTTPVLEPPKTRLRRKQP